MTITTAWTAEDSKRLHKISQEFKERAARERAQEIVSFNADLTIGALLVSSFNSVVNTYGRLGLTITWTAFYPEGTRVRYVGFNVSGRRALMEEFYAWYHEFFRL